MMDPARATGADRRAFVDAMRELLGRDYRGTKGRRGRAERAHADERDE